MLKLSQWVGNDHLLTNIMATKNVIPSLTRLDISEAQAVESMFRLYDYKCTGRIPQHLAYKLVTALGFDVSIHSLPLNGSLKEILLFLDMRIVDPEPALFSQMHSFTHLVAKKIDLTAKKQNINDKNSKAELDASLNGNDTNGAQDSSGNEPSQDIAVSREKYITTQSINDFMISLGRPPLRAAQVELLLTSMLEYDDCNETTGQIAAVLPDIFSRDFTTFAKKSNALKNFK